ncbi:MAG: VCBS repeat-containing protein [Ferruginibacter sp.]|nr:VCBS repeat-containing protein [Ferruginibacter sp.]
MNFKHLLYWLCTGIIFCGCKSKIEPLFSMISATQTGIDFENRITDTDSLNILDYLYYYNGGGVAIADFNNDGLPDIYFTSNQGSNKLYLNKGNFKFEDITDKAGVQGKGNWKTGVTVADVNGDGLLDIYVCEVGGYKSFKGRNELFINNGITSPSSTGEGRGEITFTESAHAYGLDIQGLNTQAVFFDYDHDGDLDMFLVNHSVHSNQSYGDSSMRRIKDEASGDKLFRNDSTATGRKFVEVTTEAGIYSSVVGYGLNVAVADINNDGWDDIYVSNDFHENDYYYLNNHNGHFSEINRDAFGHESRFSMGSAIADMNNDGWQDIITLDMLPSDEKTLKSSAGDDPLDIYNFKFSFGYYHQYSRNCLQINAGGGKKFSDIALYAGVAATDWSWSPLAADFDNDGIKDLFISNGILRRPNDLDFVKFYSTRSTKDTGRSADVAAIKKMPEGKVNNYIFKGTDSLKFIDNTIAWGMDHPGFSNGAAYADLDNDGDLDIIINNINEPATIYRNNAIQQLNNHFIEIELKGAGQNKFAIGAKVVIQQKNKIQVGYVNATKGFESAALQYIHFGTGVDSVIDKMEVLWPDGQSQIFTGVKADQRITVLYKNAGNDITTLLPISITTKKLFTDITDSVQLPYKHQENSFNDFNVQSFIPHMISTQGPKLAVADVNGDGLDDFFVCGAAGQAGTLFQQTAAGKFISTNQKLFAADAACEDVNSIFFDADNDGDLDLYVVSGGNETEAKIPSLLDRLYINDGKGNFSKSTSLPNLYGNKSVAVAADIDHDGDMDLFVGGRVIAGKYGDTPNSYLLINDGKGNFRIADDEKAKGLNKIGMVTDAVWTDIDKDGWKDLVVVGEWMPVTIYKNQQGKLTNYTSAAGLQNTTGLWTTIHAADLNNDGTDELLVGNWGENSKLHASEQYPLKLFTGDLDNNGAMDQVIAIEKNGKYYTFLGKEEIEKELPALMRKKYLYYSSFAGQTIEEIFGEKLNLTKKYSANILSSVMLVNNGAGKFTLSKLPASLQWSPVFSFLTEDVNRDGKTDIISAGNFYGVLPYEGRYDAGFGTILLNAGSNHFTALSPYQSGFLASGEVRDIKKIKLANGSRCFLVARNNNTLLIFKE